ncbi:MAG: hypothetical protein KatS3mg014_1660 [Actinomycetota bacterium]|nr:MAG: hypothetical protein KatS3mg014_1660 [Actinomycetota bacterium]
MERSVVFGFILGTGRCGSTLIHDLVARHPDVGFLSNLDDRLGRALFGGRWNSPLYRRVPPALTRKGAPALRTVRGLPDPRPARVAGARRAVPRPRRVRRHALAGGPVRERVPEPGGRPGPTGVPAQVHRMAAGEVHRGGAPRLAFRARGARRASGRELPGPDAVVGWLRRTAAMELRPALGGRRGGLGGGGPVVSRPRRARVEDPHGRLRGRAGGDPRPRDGTRSGTRTSWPIRGGDWRRSWPSSAWPGPGTSSGAFRRYRFDRARAEAYRRDLAPEDVAGPRGMPGSAPRSLRVPGPPARGGTGLRVMRRSVLLLIASGLVAGLATAPPAGAGASSPSLVAVIGGGTAGHASMYPSGVDVGQAGNIYVADTGDDRVCRFGPDGVEHWCQGSRGPKALGRFENPRDVAVLDGRLYVAGHGLQPRAGPRRGHRFPHRGLADALRHHHGDQRGGGRHGVRGDPRDGDPPPTRSASTRPRAP